MLMEQIPLLPEAPAPKAIGVTGLIKDPYAALAYTAAQLNAVESDTWIIPQSGGKDSRATMWSALILIAEGRVRSPKRIVTYFADTLMEYPSFIQQAQQALDECVAFAQKLGIEAHSFTTRPRAEDDFWVRIIGKGLAPPTLGMRWCTDKLKIVPSRDVLKKQGWYGDFEIVDDKEVIHPHPVLLGVRYGESDRRDKILSCSVGGECGPDVMLHRDRKVPKVQPIVKWSQCAVWDFLTLIALSYGFEPQGLIDHYGPDGSLRYGCWSCPLIYDDKTGRYLAKFNPPLAELVRFANQQFRSGGAAWKVQNRELFKKSDALKDGRLSLSYCKRLFDWMVDFEHRYGQQLLEPWQKLLIQGLWEYRRVLPGIQADCGGQAEFELNGNGPISIRQTAPNGLK
jgi:DNA sulfur modification protein DndC